MHWPVAFNKPMHSDDRALSVAALHKKRQRWLGYHDKQTEGLMGLLPMIRGIPVRLTESVNRRLGRYRNRRGTLVGWTLHPNETSQVEGGSHGADLRVGIHTAHGNILNDPREFRSPGPGRIHQVRGNYTRKWEKHQLSNGL